MALIDRTRSYDTRERGTLKQVAYWSKFGTTQTTTSDTASFATGSAKLINDVGNSSSPKTKGSRRKSAVHFKLQNPKRIVLNPVTIVSVDHDNKDGIIIIPGDGKSAPRLTLTGNLCGLYGAPTIPFYSLAFSTFLAKYSGYLLNKVAAKAQQPQHDFGVTLGELTETVAMLVNPISSLVKFSSKYLPKGLKFIRQHRAASYNNTVGNKPFRECYIDFSRCDRHSRKLARMLKNCRNVRMGSVFGQGRVRRFGMATINEASGFWLGYRFGIQPAIGEIESIASMYADGARKIDPITRHRARVVVSNTEDITCEWLTCFSSQLQYRMVRKHLEFYSATLYCGRKFTNSVGDALRNIGLHPLQLPGILWELVPLSFIIDRFIDIGSFLTAKTPNQSITHLGNAASHKIVDEYHVNIIGARNKTYPQLTGLCSQSGSYTAMRQEYSRLVELPMPKYPAWNPKLIDFEQYIDHLTLLWQKMPKLR